MKTAILTILLLVIANIFMTFAWYGHLKLQASGISTNWPLYLVILFSWGIALAEYFFQVPASGSDNSDRVHCVQRRGVQRHAFAVEPFLGVSVADRRGLSGVYEVAQREFPWNCVYRNN